ncbi:MAG: thiamine pyrophosphate-binding protein [Gammaproteobacteria bacterium]|jgi:acetolactate synthase-1/2/3 large subunit|nr:thiamine pyrophosphate-binding protein [Gammaproteobacteria bacterium]
MNGGQSIARVLQSHGVKFLFTLCGGHISPILKSAKDLGIRIVDVRHEATAVFAADAVARISGVPGVAAVTAGPGATNTITAVKNAQLAQSPVVLLGGAAATVLKGRGALQDIDQLALFKPHVKWATAVSRVRDLAPALAKAFRIAQSGVPGPVFVECPVDLLYDESLIREWYAASTPKGNGLQDRAVRAYLNYRTKRLFAGVDDTGEVTVSEVAQLTPATRDIDRAVASIAKAERPVLVVGSQALVDSSQAAAVATAIESLGIPVYLSGMARGLMGAAHPLHRRHQRRKALREADLVILAGVPSDFRLDYGRNVRRSACLISANRSRVDLNRNRRPDIGASADAGLFLRGLANKLEAGVSSRWQAWQAQLLSRDADREREIDTNAGRSAEFLNPVSLCRSIDAGLPDNSVLIADGGDFVGTASYIVKPRKPLTWLDPGVFGTLGCGAGFALGASMCYPDHAIWILFGDGSVGYALAEFDTFARHNIPVIAVVGNDAGWTQIAREQVKILDDDVGTVLERSDYHEVAAALGGKGILLKHADQTASCLQEARDAAAKNVPVLLNSWLDKTDFREGSLSM